MRLRKEESDFSFNGKDLPNKKMYIYTCKQISGTRAYKE